VDRDPLATALAIMTVHLGRREDLRAETRLADHGDRPALPGTDRSERPLDELEGDERLVADGELIVDLIGHDATSEDVGELIVALGMLGAILTEEAAEASGRTASAVLRELALRYAA
jgi:hypothetical protein